MLSYATIGRINSDFAVCEVELMPSIDARTTDFFCISCFTADVPIRLFTNKNLPIKEGFVYTVLHNGETVDDVVGIDDAEKRRRDAITNSLLMDVFG